MPAILLKDTFHRSRVPVDIPIGKGSSSISANSVFTIGGTVILVTKLKLSCIVFSKRSRRELKLSYVVFSKRYWMFKNWFSCDDG